MYLSMGQAAKLVGMPGSNRMAAQRLRRFLLAKEKKCRRKFVVERGTRRPRFFVTEAALRQHCPELFNKTDDVASQLRAFFRQARADQNALRQEVAEIRSVVETLADAYGSRFGKLASVR